MKTSAVLLALIGSASAFTAPAVPSLRTTAAPRTTMSARPEQNAAAAAIAGALLLSSPMAMPDSAFAAVAPNPYAKVRSQSFRSTSRRTTTRHAIIPPGSHRIFRTVHPPILDSAKNGWREGCTRCSPHPCPPLFSLLGPPHSMTVNHQAVPLTPHSRRKQPEEAAPAAPVNRDSAGGPSPVVIVGGVLVGSVALSFPFFKRWGLYSLPPLLHSLLHCLFWRQQLARLPCCLGVSSSL